MLLDNPIWGALRTRQADVAIGAGLARRFPADMAPFIAIGEDGPDAVAAMAPLAGPGETLTMVGVVPASPAGWVVERTAAVSQMIYDGRRADAAGDEGIAALGEADVPEMLGLTALVYPEYFRPRTIAMGAYFGIRHEGRLIAMAGQRLWPDGHREISAVCTHPDYRGRGHAGRLIARLVAAIRAEGSTPFLHVDAGNAGARAAYEKAGFAWRRDLPLLRIRRAGS